MADVLQSDLLLGEGFAHGFSLRTGGVSRPPFDSLNLARSVGDAPEDVAENHRRFGRAVGFDPDRLFEVSQVHGGEVFVAGGWTSPQEARLEQADALVAGGEGMAVGQALRELAEEVDAAPQDVLVAIGPHIRVGAFEVGDEVAAHLSAAAPQADVVAHVAGGKPRVDLAGVVRAQLRIAGVPEAQVEDVGGCTHDEPERFFSYRRDGRRSGRHLAVIVARG